MARISTKLAAPTAAKTAPAAKAAKPNGKAPAADTNIAKLGAALQSKADAKAKEADSVAKAVSAAKLSPSTKAAVAKAAKATKAKAKTAAPTTSKPEAKGLIVSSATVNRTTLSHAKDPEIKVVCDDGRSVTIKTSRVTAEINKLISVGGAFTALETALAKTPTPVLARGVESRTNPHCSKAMADGKVKAAPTAKAAKTKAPRATTSKRGDDATPFTVLVQASDSGVRPGTDRYERLAAVAKAKTLGEALAAKTASGKAIAMDNIRGMEKRGHVKLG